MHQSLQGASFHVEHIVPTAKGGTTELENLAWACPGCNLRKSDRVEACDPESGVLVSLFHPRWDTWSNHFEWEDYTLVARTLIGRTSISALDLNHPRRIQVRKAEQLFGLFPPERDIVGA
jgi:hypothetical protein